MAAGPGPQREGSCSWGSRTARELVAPAQAQGPLTQSVLVLDLPIATASPGARPGDAEGRILATGWWPGCHGLGSTLAPSAAPPERFSNHPPPGQPSSCILLVRKCTSPAPRWAPLPCRSATTNREMFAMLRSGCAPRAACTGHFCPQGRQGSPRGAALAGPGEPGTVGACLFKVCHAPLGV